MNDATVNGGGMAGDGMVSHLQTHGESVADLVTLLTDRALAISERAARAPSSVRISAGPVLVEISWPESLPVPTEIRGSLPSPAAVPAGVPAGVRVGVPAGVPAAPELDAAAPPAGAFRLCAGTVGTFYRSPEPGAAPFVAEGDLVQPGQQVAIIEAMKLMIPVEAEREGEVVEFLVADRAPVEYGQPLILLREVGR